MRLPTITQVGTEVRNEALPVYLSINDFVIYRLQVLRLGSLHILPVIRFAKMLGPYLKFLRSMTVDDQLLVNSLGEEEEEFITVKRRIDNTLRIDFEGIKYEKDKFRASTHWSELKKFKRKHKSAGEAVAIAFTKRKVWEDLLHGSRERRSVRG